MCRRVEAEEWWVCLEKSIHDSYSGLREVRQQKSDGPQWRAEELTPSRGPEGPGCLHLSLPKPSCHCL